MLKLLLKKQMSEIFRQYFFNYKKNEPRSKGATAGFFVLFVILIGGVMGGMFGFLAYALVDLASYGYGWLYFVILGGAGIIFGTVGSVFNTYSGLYLAKDNDLLLSMPIPPRTIVASRVIGVYLMGLIYSASAMIPAAVVYIVFVPQTAMSVIGALFMVLLVSAIVFFLSSLLGWVVAKIAKKLKNRSFAIVLISLAFIALYYFVYFKAMNLIRDLIANAALYGDTIKGKAYPVYLFGMVGEGDLKAIAIFGLSVAALIVLAMAVISRTFVKIATSSADTAVTRRKSGNIKAKGVFGALLTKEFARFKSSATYMLNCALATLLLPLVGIFALIKSDLLIEITASLRLLGGLTPAALACVIVLFLSSMNMITTPSVALEGNTHWLIKSLPVDAKMALRAKIALQLVLTTPAVLFCSVCLAFGLHLGALDALLLILTTTVSTVFMAVLGLAMGLRNPNFNWTREVVPIKQSLDVFLSMIGGFVGSILCFVVLFLFSDKIGSAACLAIITAVYAAGSAALYAWLMKQGAAKYGKI